jgi:hypothetical protein
MSEYLNVMIGYQVGSTAEWRRRKAEEFPDDRRNVKAAEELERLEAEIDRIGESETIHLQIAELHDSLNAIDDGDGWLHIGEVVSEELRSIGFHGGYETGLKLLEWYRNLLQEQLDECLDEAEAEAVPVPNLDEQIENDPAVKAAKQAYDEARAKAYAEARKRL